VKVQDEANLHIQEKKVVSVVEWKWCGGLSKDNLKHKHKQYLIALENIFPMVYNVPQSNLI
jgi:hypothetical protein